MIGTFRSLGKLDFISLENVGLNNCVYFFIILVVIKVEFENLGSLVIWLIIMNSILNYFLNLYSNLFFNFIIFIIIRYKVNY